MQESAELVLGEAHKLVENLDSATIDGLCSRERKKRGAAVDKILKTLDPKKNPIDNDILQTLPLALITAGEYIGTLYFLEYCIENGAFFSTSVINAVIDAVTTERMQCRDDGDIEATGVITQILHRLYNVILTNQEYQKLPEIYLSIGTDQEREKNIFGAIALYNEAMGLGSLDAYFCIASAYESQGNYDMSATVFDAAYQISGEERFLHRYINALCKAGKREEAYTYYLYLQDMYQKTRDKRTINPFIVYVGTITNDADLHEFELLMTAYFIESSFEPSENLRELALSAAIYIANEIEKESSILEELNMVPIETWTDEQDSIYRQSIKRRLFLMQTHIITLQDPRYLDFYLDEMKNYTLSGNPRMQKMMHEYFTESFSSYTFASHQQMNPDDKTTIDDMELIESIRFHLIQISEIFSQFSFYEIIRDKIVPFEEECMKMEGISDDIESQDESTEGALEAILQDEDVQILKKEFHDYNRRSKMSKKMYEDYIEFIDKKYGMFYRRSIQQLVRREMIIPVVPKDEYEKVLKEHNGDHVAARDFVLRNMNVFLDYPDIALLFLLEKIIVGQDILAEDEAIGSLIEHYGFDSLSGFDALLFGFFLYEDGQYHDAIEYMRGVPGMLRNPQLLSMITESIRYIDDDEDDFRKTVIQNIDTICQQEYGTQSFFEHVGIVSQKIFESPEPSDDDIGYMLLAIANMHVIQEGDTNEIIKEFEKAGDYGLSQGYSSAGDIQEELQKYDQAIESYRKAYLLDPNIKSIRNLIGVFLMAAGFDEAWDCITIAIDNDYDVNGYISAWYLYQGNYKEAIEELCRIVQSDGMIDLVLPDGYMEFLNKAVKEILNSGDESIEHANLKILASYIDASLSDMDDDSSDPEDYIKHIAFIGGIMDEYTSEDVCKALLASIPLLTGEIDFNDARADVDQVTGYLHLHLTKIHGVLMRYHTKNKDARNAEATIKTFELLNALNTSSITLLQRFPNTEKYLIVWRNAMNHLPFELKANHTIYEMPTTIQ